MLQAILKLPLILTLFFKTYLNFGLLFPFWVQNFLLGSSGLGLLNIHNEAVCWITNVPVIPSLYLSNVVLHINKTKGGVDINRTETHLSSSVK